MNDTRTWVIGIDPGRVNLGLAFYNRHTGEARLLNVDLTVHSNTANAGRLGKVKYEEKFVFSTDERIVNDFHSYFDDAYIVATEKQLTGLFHLPVGRWRVHTAYGNRLTLLVLRCWRTDDGNA